MQRSRLSNPVKAVDFVLSFDSRCNKYVASTSGNLEYTSTDSLKSSKAVKASKRDSGVIGPGPSAERLPNPCHNAGSSATSRLSSRAFSDTHSFYNHWSPPLHATSSIHIQLPISRASISSTPRSNSRQFSANPRAIAPRLHTTSTSTR
jgi:hypothetical protein